MALNWRELLKTSPHELRLSGPKHAKQIEDENGLNDIIFRIYSLNFMEVSKTALNVLPIKIKELENLTHLMLYDNKLEQLPKEIGLLKKLKTLDLSNNKIAKLPKEMSQLGELQSLNITSNMISELPKDLSNWSNLIVIKFSHNKFQHFPQGLCSPTFRQHLTEIHATDNEINNLPLEICHLSALRHLDLTNNKIEVVPGELADCTKIKTLALKNNKIKDVRLKKLAENNPTKQILQYVAKSCKRGGVSAADADKGPKGSRKKNISSSSDKSVKDSGSDAGGQEEQSGDENEASKDQEQQQPQQTQVEVKKPEPLHPTHSSRKTNIASIGTIEILAVHPDNWFIIEADSSMLDERKIVACIVRNLSFPDEKAVKKFLTLQTNLHDTVCGRRELATIATHDMSKITPRIQLVKMLSHRVQLVPLNRGGKAMSGLELYKQLNQEAEAYRKEKKRNNYSGIHKYLYLLKGKTHYPVVKDGNDTVITLPPLTNAEHTKITTETTDVLVEITGSKTPNCKKALDTLLHDMLKLEIASKKKESDPLPTLQVEPVRVVRKDEEQKLFVVYPSKIDLIFDDLNIVRQFD